MLNSSYVWDAEIWAKNITNASNMEIFPNCDPEDFFSKSGSVTFVPLWYPNFVQKIRINQLMVSEILKDGSMDRHTDKGPNAEDELDSVEGHNAENLKNLW